MTLRFYKGWYFFKYEDAQGTAYSIFKMKGGK